MLPVKCRSRVAFPARGNIAMADNATGNDVGPGQHDEIGGTCQLMILPGGIRNVIGALQLNPDGEVVAFFLPLKTRSARMPGAIKQADKLDNVSITTNQQVSRDLNAFNGPEIGMGRMIKTITEEVFNFRAAETPRRKAYIVHNQQGNGSAIRARPEVWRGAPAGEGNLPGFTERIPVGTGIGKVRGQNV